MAKYFSDSLLGNWNRGVTFIQVPVDQVINSIKNIIYSKYAELSDDTESLHFNLTRLVGAFSIIIFPLNMLVIPFVPFILESLFTNKWEYLTLIAQILLASTAIGVIYNLTESCLESANHQDICFRSALVAGTTSIILSFASFFSKNWLILALIPIVSPLIGHLCQLILWRHRQNGDIKILIRIYLRGFIFGMLFFGLVTIAVSSKQIISAKSILALISFCIVMIVYLSHIKKISLTELLSVSKILS
jgi:O-antigen/teichoic acid export membrane protein